MRVYAHKCWALAAGISPSQSSKGRGLISAFSFLAAQNACVKRHHHFLNFHHAAKHVTAVAIGLQQQSVTSISVCIVRESFDS
jgi:hypothetical protein